MICDKEKEIIEIMTPIHQKILEKKFISWGTLIRAGIKCYELKELNQNDK